MPYLEQGNLYEVSDVVLQYHGMLDSSIQAQESFYYCPTRRSPPQLSVSGDGRGHIPHRPGALADYAIGTGDGSAVPWWATAPGGGNGFARSTHIFDPPPVRLSGKWSGSTPFLRYKDWKIVRKIQHVTDGLSNTLLAGEKYVHAGHWGEGAWGDNTFYNDDSGKVTFRMAGSGFPIVLSPDDRTITASTAVGSFGSQHKGACACLPWATAACGKSILASTRSCWDICPTSATVKSSPITKRPF